MNSRYQKRPIATAIEAIIVTKPAHINEAEMTESAVLELEAVDDDQHENDAGWLIEMLAVDIDRKRTLPIFESDIKKEQAAIVKTIGIRMREARELCNMSQSVAAKRLGYANSSKLAKVENSTDTNSVPLHLTKRAATLYEVSIDYLFGMTDDFDSKSYRPAGEWLASALEQSRLRDLESIGKLHNEVRLVSRHIPAVVELAKELDRAVGSFRQSNPEFDEMRSSARVVGSLERLMSAANTALGELRRLDRKMGLTPH